MKTYKHLFEKLVSIENLQDAYWKARKHKFNNPAVREFEKHAKLHLAVLHKEIRTRTYRPQPLKMFILHDPKTRKICVSAFRDRIVHHALVNMLQPIFEPRFIHDSYASRKGKGTLAALKRFDSFLRKVTDNGKQVPESLTANAVCGFVFKADIRHYFDTVDHAVLLGILGKRVKDDGVLWLTEIILQNYHSGMRGRGMPLGNWTSQFFANVYLNELDQFVKHELGAKYYLRYVDDFVILERSKTTLQGYEKRIKAFLQVLKLNLHPSKCKISPLCRGIGLLGFRKFYHHTLVRQRNIRKIWKKLTEMLDSYTRYGTDWTEIIDTLEGWNAYAQHANTHHLRARLTHVIHEDLVRRSDLRKLSRAKKS